MTLGTPTVPVTRAPRVGESAPRPDGIPKVTGDFAFSSDLWADDMLWGHTLRSPHPHARIRSIDLSGALAIAGVHAVLTHEDVPGSKIFGLEHRDQPVLAIDTVRYQGEAVAIVARVHGDDAHVLLTRRAHDPERNLPAVGDQYTGPAHVALPLEKRGTV